MPLVSVLIMSFLWKTSLISVLIYTQTMLKVLNKSSPPEYFTPHLGEYVNVLSALEKLNVAILKAMDKTKEVGDDSFLSALC